MASIVVAGDTSGTVTLAAPAVSGTTTLTLPTTSGTIVTTSGAQTIEFADGSASAPSITNSGDTNTGMFFPAADTIAFAEGGTESVRIDSSGQLLMGTTGGYDSNATGAITLNANAPDGTVNFKKGVVFSSDGGDNPFVWAHAGITSTGSPGFNGNLLFGTDGSGTQTSTITERMRIDSSGNLLVGTTSQIDQGLICAAYNGQAKQGIVLKDTNATLNGSYMYFINSAGSLAGQIQRIGTTTVAYGTSSDYRLKENVAPITNALDKLTQLKPVTYTWKDTDNETGEGFIAHELQEVCPFAVIGEKDAVDAQGNPVYQSIDTSFLVATLTAAIQEQQAIINDLKTRIEALEAK